MGVLRFIQHLFTLQAITRELSDQKVRTKQVEAELQAERQKHEEELRMRETTIKQLRQENKEFHDLPPNPIVVESKFDL